MMINLAHPKSRRSESKIVVAVALGVKASMIRIRNRDDCLSKMADDDVVPN